MNVDLLGPDEETGDPPETRVRDYEQFMRLYRAMKQADFQAAVNRALVQDLVDGKPPRNQADLDAAGYGDFCNVNFLEAQAGCDQAKTTFTGLGDSVATLIRVKTRYGESQAEREQWQNKINEEYTYLMRTIWPSYRSHKQSTASGLVTDGLRVPYWPHDVDWRPEVGKPGQFLFTDDAVVDESRQEVILQEEEVTATRLYRLLKKDDEVKKAGDESNINRKMVEKAILDACKKDDRLVGKSINEIFRDNDLCASYASSQKITLVHGYIAEYEGGITHYIGRADAEGDDFLYKKTDAMPSMEDSFVFYADGVGNDKLTSLKGLIWRAYPAYYQKNELLCQAFDAAKLASILALSLKNGTNYRDAMAQLRFDRVTVLPEGVEVVQQGLNPPGLQSTLALLGKTDVIASNNTGGYQQHDFSPGEGRRTAREVQLQAANQAQIGSALILNWYQAEEKWNRIIFKRLQNKEYFSRHPGWKERQEFLERLEKRGVPLQAFWEVYEVNTVRAVGLGSPAQQGAAFQLLDAKRVFADPVGQRAIDRIQLTAAQIEQSIIDECFPNLNQPRVTQQDRDARDENASFATLLPIMPLMGDDPYIHIPQHLPFLDLTFQQLQQGAIDLRGAVGRLGSALSHIQAHLQECKDPQRVEQVKAWGQAFEQAGKQFHQMTQELQVQQQQPQDQSDNSAMSEQAEEARKQQAFEADQARQNAANQAEIERKNLQAVTTANQRQESHEQKLIHGSQNQVSSLVPVQQQQPLIITP